MRSPRRRSGTLRRSPADAAGGLDPAARATRTIREYAPLFLRHHQVHAVAVGALPDGTPVIVSGGNDAKVRVWRLADGSPLVPPLDLPERVTAVAAHGNVIITAAGADNAVHQPALLQPQR